VVTRSPGEPTPKDLAQHLSCCSLCTEAEKSLRAYHDALPRLLAKEALGWGGPAYLEQRRISGEQHFGTVARAGFLKGILGRESDTAEGRWGMAGMAVSAVMVTAGLTALALPLLSSEPADVAVQESVRGQSDVKAGPTVSISPIGTGDGTPPTPSASSASPTPTAAAKKPAERVAAPSATEPTAADTGLLTPASCKAEYKLAGQWPGGFKGYFLVTSQNELTDWELRWTLPDGQRITEVYGGTFSQDGAEVTMTPAEYKRAVPAGGSFDLVFLATWQDRNSPPVAVTLNGRRCSG
jgi:hypothetical protein